MIDDIARRGVTPFGCIVGEPTGMRTVVAHKGKRSWRCRVHGFEAHSSLTPHGVNAVEIACEIVAYLANMARAFRDQGPFDRAYDVAWTTVHTGVIHGGTALNIVPRDCSFDFEIRHLPHDDPEALFAEIREYAERFLPAMRKVDPDTFIEFDALSATPGFDTRRRRRDRAACRVFAAARSATARSRSAPRRRCSTARTSRRSSAAPGTSRRRTSRTSGSRASSSSAAKTFVRRLGDELCVRLSRAARTRRAAGAMNDAATGKAPPPIEVAFPDLRRWAGGNAGIPYVHTFASGKPGPHVVVQALTHGNEVCGAIALDWLLDSGVRPARGTLSLVFANVGAYERFDRADPFGSRCVDEDFNRLWTADVLDGAAHRAPSSPARARCGRSTTATDYLLDLHSMTEPCPPLAMAGRQRKGVAARPGAGISAVHRRRRRARRGQAAARLRVLRRSRRSAQRAARSNAASIGKPRPRTSRSRRRCASSSISAWPTPTFLDAHLDAAAGARAAGDRGHDVVTIGSDDVRLRRGRQRPRVVREAGTLLARDGGTEVRTPYADCVLIMPTRRPKKGETAVRLGRFVG